MWCGLLGWKRGASVNENLVPSLQRGSACHSFTCLQFFVHFAAECCRCLSPWAVCLWSLPAWIVNFEFSKAFDTVEPKLIVTEVGDGSAWQQLHLNPENWFTQIRLENCKAARWTKPALPHSEHGLLFPIAARRGTRVGGAHVFFGKVFGLESQHRRKCACFQPRCSLDGSLTTCLLLHEMQWKLSKWRMLWTHCTR